MECLETLIKTALKSIKIKKNSKNDIFQLILFPFYSHFIHHFIPIKNTLMFCLYNMVIIYH